MTLNDTSIIDYDKLVENSLRHVVTQTLKLVEQKGLPGDHHFYITFFTKFAGVKIPNALLKTYPEEMTIVIQHQFFDLNVEEEQFSISLSFNNVQHNLTIPYSSISYYADPHAKFGLKFNIEKQETPDVDDDTKITHLPNVYPK